MAPEDTPRAVSESKMQMGRDAFSCTLGELCRERGKEILNLRHLLRPTSFRKEHIWKLKIWIEMVP